MRYYILKYKKSLKDCVVENRYSENDAVNDMEKIVRIYSCFIGNQVTNKYGKIKFLFPLTIQDVKEILKRRLKNVKKI